MPWKIVNLEYSDRAHLHIKDPNAPIHLRAFFDGSVEIALGAEDPEDCFVRATVTQNDVRVDATRFEKMHVNILGSILASLDVEPDERDDALAWMHARIAEMRTKDVFPGNVEAFPPPTGWPYDLTDGALRDSIDDDEAIPVTRRKALHREARRRGISPPRTSPQPAGRGPEVIRRRRDP
jgi:hypothetical protein